MPKMTKKEERLWRNFFRSQSELSESLRAERSDMEKRLSAVKGFLRLFEWMSQLERLDRDPELS